MLMNLKIANTQPTAPHENISKLFQPHQIVLVSPVAHAGNDPSQSTVVRQPIANNHESMEVSLDPEMFLAEEESIVIEDDEETVSAAEAKIETEKLQKLKDVSEVVKKTEKRRVTFKDIETDSNKTKTTSCPEVFATCVELENHATSHLLASPTSTSSTKSTIESAIEKPIKKRKVVEEKIRSKRKKIVIRINPSPSKRNNRERVKILPKFVCSICKKALSSKRNLHLHHETHKEPSGKFKCDTEPCKKLFGKLENFLKHRQEHERLVKRRKNQNEK